MTSSPPLPTYKYVVQLLSLKYLHAQYASLDYCYRVHNVLGTEILAHLTDYKPEKMVPVGAPEEAQGFLRSGPESRYQWLACLVAICKTGCSGVTTLWSPPKVKMLHMHKCCRQLQFACRSYEYYSSGTGCQHLSLLKWYRGTELKVPTQPFF